MFKYEKIVDQNFKVFGYEVLCKNASEINWSDLSCSELNCITLNQIDEVSLIGCQRFKYFLNLEGRQIYDISFINRLSLRVRQLEERGISVIFEITERDTLSRDSKDLLDTKITYGFVFALDDLIERDCRWFEIESGLYDYVKIDDITEYLKIKERLKSILLRSTGMKLIIEKIEDLDSLLKVELNDFILCQGYYF